MNDKDLTGVRTAPPDAMVGNVPHFDAAKYLQHLDGLDLTEEQKTEFLKTLWFIMGSFVNLGFGVDSVMPLLAQRSLENGTDALQEIVPTHEFNVAAEDDAAEKEGRS